MATPIVGSAAAYGSKMAKGIITQMFRSLADQHVTIYTGIKGPTKFAKMSASKGLKPYTGTYSANAQVTFTDRELTPHLAAYEMEIKPLDYYNTWMAENIRANATAKDIPFEQIMWDMIIREIHDELSLSTIGTGDISDAGTDAAVKVTDGFLKIITAMSLTPVITGAIVLDDVIDQLEAVYTSIPSSKRKFPMNVYVSQATADLYNKKYRSLYHDKPTYNEFNQSALDVGNGKALITPVDWLSGSQVIIAPEKNMVLGTDSLSDINEIKMVETVYGYNTAIVFPIGLQIPDPEFIFVNDRI